MKSFNVLFLEFCGVALISAMMDLASYMSSLRRWMRRCSLSSADIGGWIWVVPTVELLIWIELIKFGEDTFFDSGFALWFRLLLTTDFSNCGLFSTAISDFSRRTVSFLWFVMIFGEVLRIKVGFGNCLELS